MRDEFSRKRLLSVFRYCFGNVSGLFRDWCSFYKPNFRPEISRNHAPGFLISKGTKRLRETSDNICLIPNGSCHYLYDFYQIFPDNSYGYTQKFTDNSPIFYDILQFSLNFSVFLRIFAPENPLPVKKGCGVIIFIKVLKNDEALPSAMDSRAFFFGDQRWNRWER